jgi:alanine dehydrogenase
VTLLIREDDVRALLPMKEAIKIVRDALAAEFEERAVNLPRRRIVSATGMFHDMAGAVLTTHSVGLKAYTSTRHNVRFLVALWNSESGELLALFEADWLGRIRTGAASGVATDVLARRAAAIAAIIGTGSQAETQLRALATVRSLTTVRVYSRRPENRTDFARTMSRLLDLDVQPVDSARQAVDGADLVTTITTSTTPVVEGAWLAPGTHVNAAGSNWATRREIDAEVLRRAAVVTVDSTEQAHIEAGDLIMAVEEGAIGWDQVHSIGAVLTGAVLGRESTDDITVFKSLGIAVEDIAVARYIYERARAEGRGEQTTFGE